MVTNGQTAIKKGQGVIKYNYGNMKPRIKLWRIDTGYSTTGFGFGMCD
jgi:hypothetical protein